jgi:hypothetical protein
VAGKLSKGDLLYVEEISYFKELYKDRYREGRGRGGE